MKYHITKGDLFQEKLYFYKRRTADKRGKRYIMREQIITMLYVVASFIDDIAYWVIGKGEDEKERTIHTLWGTHYY